MNKRIKEHNQKIIKKSFEFIFLSDEKKRKKAKSSLIIGKLLIIISIPVILYDLSIGLGIILIGIIQTIVALVVNKRLFLN